MKYQTFSSWVVVGLALSTFACFSASDPVVGEDLPEVRPWYDSDGVCNSTVISERVADAKTVIEDARSILQSKLKTGSRTDAIYATLGYLHSQDNVFQITSDNSAIFFSSDSGIRCGIYIDTMKPISSRQVPKLTPLPYGQPPLDQASETRRGAIYTTLTSTDGFSNSHHRLAEMPTTLGVRHGTTFEGSEVTLDSIRKMSDFDVIYIRTHGTLDQGVFNFMTGESPSGDLCPLANELRDQAIGLGTTVNSGSVYFTIYPKFFKGASFKENSLAYFSSCYGLNTPSLASIMHDQGLGAFVGWSNVVASEIEDLYTNIALFLRLFQGASLGAAITELTAENFRFGNISVDIDGEEIFSKLDYYPKPQGGKVRITLVGCDEDSECPQDPYPLICSEHQCEQIVMQPCECLNRECGLDPDCAEWYDCGSCKKYWVCNESGICEPPDCPAAKDCTDRVCGPDPACGESCGDCLDTEVCDSRGRCMPNVPGICANGWCLIPAGTFNRGSPDDEPDRYDNEGPVHSVTISRPFYMKQTLVTQAEWRLLSTVNPSYFAWCDDCPVERVSWFEAIEYANRLSFLEGFEPCYTTEEISSTNERESMEYRVHLNGVDCQGFRLPTEAEWEYAARAGTTEARYGELEQIAWYKDNSEGTTHPVGQKTPNAWGLHDVLGNVMEWATDHYGSYGTECEFGCTDPCGPTQYSHSRSVRGSYWDHDAKDLRFARRSSGDEWSSYSSIGFRLVRTVPPAQIP